MTQDPAKSLHHFFVYGTLKRGQCRERMWPAAPLRIAPAWTLGHLYGRDDYPAMTTGTDRVLGECWTYESSDVEAVFKTLDEIEGTEGNSPTDLYHRHEIQIHLLDDETRLFAQAYFYVKPPETDGFQRIQPDANHHVVWPPFIPS
ncbi:gamma-glutamylcyclotransferase family protein [Stieleria varia]|uniref:AIG2-like family protein n=1 Tax=Stieleria varia TaxID=2528005 RepID=A0A5C6B910_9BACT|nr:gamma-glutamylcyclotransferase family protein [Stieleria varia]TWU08563.1 AIG2-like family protein [Stieleria varia]